MQELTALERLRILFNWIFPPVYRQIFELSDKGYKPVIFQKEETIVYNLVKLISSYLHQFKEPNSEETITDQQGDELKAQLPPLGNKGAFVDSVFTFGLAWSLGAVGDQSLRQEFTAIFRHIAYDIPQLLIQNAQVAGVDMNGAKYKFSPSGHKTNQATLDQIALRAQEYQQSYKKLLPIGVPMFAIDYTVPLSPTLAPGQKKQNSRERFVELIQDVCIGAKESEGDLKGDSGRSQPLTAMVVAERQTVNWMFWAESQYAIQIPEFTDVNQFNDTIVPTPDVISLVSVMSMLAQ